MDNVYQRRQMNTVRVQIPENVNRRWFKMFIVELNLLFLIYCIYMFARLAGFHEAAFIRITAYAQLIIYFGMIVCGFGAFAQAKRCYVVFRIPQIRFAMHAYAVVWCLMILQAWNNVVEGSTVASVYTSAIIWTLPVVAVFGMDENNWRTIRKVVCWHSAIACLLMLALLPTINAEVIHSNPLTERLNIGEIGGGVLGPVEKMMYGSSFLLFSFWLLPPTWRIIALVTGGMFLWITLLGQFRSGVGTVLLSAIIGLLYIPFRALNQKKHLHVGLASSVLTVGALLVCLFVAQVQFKDRIPIAGELVSAVINRGVTVGDEGMQSAWSVRSEESRLALMELAPLQFMIGKGFGASWSGGSMYYERRYMCHLGYGHLILYGGFLLLILVYGGPVLKGLRVLLFSRSDIELICASVVFVRAIDTTMANVFDNNINFILLVLCVGGLFIGRGKGHHISAFSTRPWTGT